MSPTGLTVYRRSELEAADCLHRYHAVWVDGLDDANDYSLRGIAFHKIKHVYIEKLVAAGLSQDFELAAEAFVEGIAAAHTPARLIPEVRELWERHAPHFELDLTRLVLAEEKQESGGFAWTPDYVYAHPERNELEINDDKTFFIGLTETQARQSFQPRFYIRRAMDLFPGFSSYRFTYHFVRFGSHLSIVFKRDDLNELDREVTALMESIELAKQTNYWPAAAGPSCSYCQLACPLVDQALTVPKRLETPQKALQLASWTLAADQMIKSAKKSLKQYCAVNGAIDVGGVQWDNRPVLERKYPVTVVAELLRLRGVLGAFDGEPGQDPMTISHSALAKLFKKFPDLEDDLAASVIQKTTYRFSARKPGIDDAGSEE